MMKIYSAVFPFLLVVVAHAVSAQSLPAVAEQDITQPLNLSTRKPVVPATSSEFLNGGSQAQTDKPSSMDSGSAEGSFNFFGLRFGSGYESRNQGASRGENGSGSESKSGKSGSDSDGGKSSGRGESRGGDGKGSGGGKSGGKGD